MGNTDDLILIYIRFRCNVCDKKIKCDHMGKKDVIMHCKSKSHLDQAKALKAKPKLPFQGAQSNEELNRTEAELKMAVLTASSNVPLAFHDCLSPTIRKVFPPMLTATPTEVHNIQGFGQFTRLPNLTFIML